MTYRTVHLPVAAQDRLDDILEIGMTAEELGFHRLWFPETWGRDAVTTLTALADQTEDIGIGTSILNTYSRSPALVGQTAATLQEHSDGRFRLGVGPSGPAVVEGWHGQSFERPLRRTREYIDIVRNVLSGEPVNYDGDMIQMRGFKLRQGTPNSTPSDGSVSETDSSFGPPEIDVTGMGPKAVELAGRFADGWHAIMFTQDGLRDRLTDLRRGAELGNRDPNDVRTTLVLQCCALPDSDAARDLARQHLAFYVGGMGTFYRDALSRQGHENTANTIYDAWQDGEHKRAIAAVDDTLLNSLAAVGTPEEARERFEEFEAIDGVDAIAVSFPRAANRETIDATLDALSPE